MPKKKVKKKAKKKAAPKSAKKIDYKGIMEWWNELADRLGLSRLQSFKQARRDRVRQRLHEPESPFANLALLAKKIESQPFLHGENFRGWRLSFDTLFERKKMPDKILEGGYLRAKKVAGAESTPDPLEEARKRMEQAEKDGPF